MLLSQKTRHHIAYFPETKVQGAQNNDTSMYDLTLSRRVSMMKFSRAISRVKWFSSLETNVSKTISVLVLRVVELHDGLRNVGL
jgi:hypothetical protein